MKPRVREVIIIFLGTVFAFCLNLFIFYSPEKQYDFYVYNTKSTTYAEGTFEDLENAIKKSNNYTLNPRLIKIDDINMLLSYNDYLKYREFIKTKTADKNKIEKEW